MVKPIAFYVLFTIIAFYNLDINQMDMKIVFPHGDITNYFMLNSQKVITKIKNTCYTGSIRYYVALSNFFNFDINDSYYFFLKSLSSLKSTPTTAFLSPSIA